MQKKVILFIGAALLMGSAPALQAKDRGEGVRLATDIVRLVKTVVAPAPAVVVAPPPAPAVIPSYSFGYYNNVYVPMYNGWYYYENVWCWGGRGPRPMHPPRWIPPRHHHRPAPPPPPRPAPPPPQYHHRAPRGGHHAPPPPPRHGGGYNRHGRR